MLLRLGSVLLGLVLAYLIRNKAIHAHLAAKRPLRALWTWLKAAFIAVPVSALVIGGLLLASELIR